MILTVESQARDQLLEKSKAVEKCFKCGTCSLVCPITRYGEGYSPTETFVYDVFSSAEPAANPSIWSCAVCHKCYEVCPQDVNPPKIIESLKETAFENEGAPAGVTALVKSVINTGIAFPVTEATKRMRAQLNLPPIVPEEVDELKKTAQNTGLHKKLEPKAKK